VSEKLDGNDTKLRRRGASLEFADIDVCSTHVTRLGGCCAWQGNDSFMKT